MKTYIFVCISIAGVGGAQIYTRNKVNYLKSKGWNVVVFSFTQRPICIQDLKQYQDGVFEALKIPSYFYTQNQQTKILASLLAQVEKSEEYIIECHAIMLSSWAELLAKRLGGRHFLYSLDEKPKVYSFIRDYMDFKLKRNEFYSISAKTVQIAFPQIASEEEAEKYHLRAFCNNAIEDVDDSHLNISFEKGINIGIFGRINKDYVFPVTNDLIRYIKEHESLFFNIVYIGGTPFPSEEYKLKKMFDGIPNAKMSITGYLSPVPISFMNKFDFFIASAGSAWATQKVGYLTVAISAYTYKSNGILGYQTEQTLLEDVHQYELKESLDDLIIFKKYAKKEIHIPQFDYDSYFMPHLNKMRESITSNEKEYFEVNSINLPIKYKFMRVVTILLGPNVNSKLKDAIYKVRG